MLYEDAFKTPKDAPELLEKIRAFSLQTGPVRLMEICGTHTMAIARSGLRTVLPENIRLLSGPGCPVCVTPANVIDMILDLSMRPGICIASYGDLLRVPGSVRGDSLLSRRASGGKAVSVYSPADAVKLAREHPDQEIVFLGVGFETTAPGTAAPDRGGPGAPPPRRDLRRRAARRHPRRAARGCGRAAPRGGGRVAARQSPPTSRRLRPGALRGGPGQNHGG